MKRMREKIITIWVVCLETKMIDKNILIQFINNLQLYSIACSYIIPINYSYEDCRTTQRINIQLSTKLRISQKRTISSQSSCPRCKQTLNQIIDQ